ncbi:MAG TPA: T9SS type A sorting domain-containing protein [Flavobacterium sp.]|jgi:hypothetical protein
MNTMKMTMLMGCLAVSISAGAQCGPVPPPPGLSYIFALDIDNDGYAPFDIGYYIDFVERPLMEDYFNVSSSGYNFVYYNGDNETVTMPIYTNVVLNENGYINFEYTGSGPLFVPQPPCYWPPPQGSGLILRAMPFDGDYDNDGVLNADEDANGNINLMDDDSDGDGIIDLADASTLAVHSVDMNNVSISPNPVTGGVISIESDEVISDISIYDSTGKKVIEVQGESKRVNVEMLQKGIYFIKFNSQMRSIFKKIAIN